MHTSRLIALPLSFFVISGCSSIRHYTSPDEDNLLSGAGSIVVKKSTNGNTKNAEAYELIDINDLLTTYNLDSLQTIATDQSKNTEEYKYKRNDLQDRLISASNQRCGTYLRILTSSKSQTQMSWGSLATLLSGAASVTTPVSAAKALAAGSTVSNAVLSMYNEAYFNNSTVNIISAGITRQRALLLSNIDKKRKAPLSEYPVNRAIADAIAYHSACNIISGLETAAAATKNATAAQIEPALE